MLDEDKGDWTGALCGLAALALPLILYLQTAMREPGVHGDYAKFAFIGKIWGLPHPSGFPLYLVLNGLFSRLPIGPLTFRVAALSSICLALAMHFFYRSGRLMGFPSLPVLGVTLLAATGRIVWMQGTIPEVYALHILLLSATLWALFRWDSSNDDRWLRAAAWMFLLGLANHLTSVFAFPGFAAFVLVRNPRALLKKRTWKHIAAAVFTVLLLYGYIFVRSKTGPLHCDVAGDGSLASFLNFVLGKDYAREWLAYSEAGRERLWSAFNELGTEELTAVGWLSAWLGMAAIAFTDWRKAVPLVMVPAGLASANFLYRTSEPGSYYAACYPFAALLAVSTPMLLIKLTGSRIRASLKMNQTSITETVATYIVVLTFFAGAVSHVYANCSRVDLSKPNPAYATAREILDSVQRPFVMFTSDYLTTMLVTYVWFADLDSRERIAITQIWNPSLAESALNQGKHVYVFAELATTAGERFNLRPVHAGLDRIELYELSPKSPP